MSSQSSLPDLAQFGPIRRRGVPSDIGAQIWKPEVISRIIQKVSHDIGNPLTSIISLATLIDPKTLGTASPERLGLYSSSITKEAWRVARLSERLAALYAPRHQEGSSVSVSTAVTRAQEKVGSWIGFTDIPVHTTFSSDDLVIAGDTEQVVLMLVELLDNAFTEVSDNQKSLGAPQELFLYARGDGKHVTITLTNPVGQTSDRSLTDLFEPLVSERKDRKLPGLGLTLAALIVARFGGSIEFLESERDGISFSTVAVTLQQRQLDARGPRGRISVSDDPSPSRKEVLSVLIIEDDSLVASAIAKMLKVLYAKHYDVEAVTASATEALERIRDGALFDAILCDLHLGEMNGTSLAQEIKSLSPSNWNRLGFLTGEKFESHLLDTVKRSGRPFIHKPFSVENLANFIASLREESST